MWIGLLVGMGVWLAVLAGWPAPERKQYRVLSIGMAALAALLSFVVSRVLVSLTDMEWNSVRAAIPYALSHGIDIYWRAGDGPLWCNIYPPVGHVLYTPVGLASTPGGVIQVGQCLSVLWYLVGFAALGWRVPMAGNKVLGLATAVVLALATALVTSPMYDSAFLVHVDAPAIGLALLAAVMFAYSPQDSKAYLMLTAALAVLSVGAKQTMIAVPLVLLVWSCLTRPRRATVELLGWLIGFGLASLLVIGLIFDWGALYYSIITVPSRHGLGSDWREWLTSGIRFGAGWLLPVLAFAAVAFIVRLRRPDRPAWRSDPAILLMVMGLALVPLSMAGYLKFGGGRNNFTYAGTFLLAGAIVVALRSFSIAGVSRSFFWLSFAGATVAGLYSLAVPPKPSGVAHQHDVAAELIGEQPGRYYFPWLPLSHLIAEKRLTHQSWGLTDRAAAHEVISREWFWKYVPPDVQEICVQREPDRFDLGYQMLAEGFPLRTEIPQLPGYRVFLRASAQP